MDTEYGFSPREADLTETERRGRIAFDLAYLAATGEWLKTAEKPARAGTPAELVSCREQMVGRTPTPDQQKCHREWLARYATWLAAD